MRSVLFIICLILAASAAAQINTLNSGVNTQFNAMAPPYNAKGDCVTDDHDAIMAAMTAACHASGSNSGANAATVYFPKPPGGCYLTSTLEYCGAPLQGQPSQIGFKQGNVFLKSQPGQDILHISDPSVVPLNLYGVLWIKDISFLLDDSVDVSASHPHRIVGRAFDDARISAGSTKLTTSNGRVTCGDVGQNIRVMGAGPSGAPLDTTIASIGICWTLAGHSTTTSFNPIVLATAASTTVSNAHAIIGVNGYRVTQTVGNAAIAFDNSNPSRWLTATHNSSNSGYALLENVNINSTSGVMNSNTGIVGQNNTAAIYWQSFAPYGLKAENVNIWRTYWGVIQACADTNSYNGGCAQDLQTWEHMMIQATNPVITYDGLFNMWKSIQLCGSNGMDFLDLGVAGETQPAALTIDTVEHECQPQSGGYGWRINAGTARIQAASISANAETAYLDGSGITCTGCTWGSLNINGQGNRVTGSGGLVTNGGHDNEVKTGVPAYAAYDQMPPNTEFSGWPMKKSYLAGEMDGSWLSDGNAASTRLQGYGRGDLIVFPEDVLFNLNQYSMPVRPDSASPTGRYIWMGTSNYLQQFTHLYYGPTATTSGAFTFSSAGGLVPKTAGTLYVSMACAGTGSVLLVSKNYLGNYAILGTISMDCTGGPSSTYYLKSVRLDLASAQDGAFDIETAASPPVKIAYIQYVPDIASINGTPVSSFVTPSGNPTVNHISCWATATTLGYCSTAPDATGACTCITRSR